MCMCCLISLNGDNKEALMMCLRASLIMCMCCCMFSAF